MTKEQFIDLITQEQEHLRRFLCALCGGDTSRADDLAQEALLKAWMSFEHFQGRSKFSTWLFRIAYNCFYDWQSRSGKTASEPLSKATDQLAPSSDEATRSFTWQPLYQAIGQLSEAEKAVVLLFYMEDKSIRDIESITGMPSGTIRSHLSRARVHLKHYLEENT